MKNVEVVYPFVDNTLTDATCIPKLGEYIDTLPLYKDCHITSTDDEYYPLWNNVSGSNMAVYTFDMYGHSVEYLPMYCSNYTGDISIFLNDRIHVNTTVSWLSCGSSVGYKGYYDTSSPGVNNLKNVSLTLVKTDYLNGFWLYETHTEIEKLTNYNLRPYIFKSFLVRSINEETGEIGYTPLFARDYFYPWADAWAGLYTTGYNYKQISDIRIAECGYSNTYVIRQLAIDQFTYPDVYIISGGLFPITDNYINIGNITYLHVCNDIFVRIS